jgi:mono/diheme cytochrome c family protein
MHAFQVLKQSMLCAGWLAVFLHGGTSFAEDSASARLKPDSVVASIVFDAESKNYDAKVGETNATFKFDLTNTWSGEVTVDRVKTSCGCTVASLPADPWHIPAGGHGEVKATINLEGKFPGLITKTITFFLSTNGSYVGTRTVTINVKIPPPPGPPALSAADREAAMAKAKADPKQIFKDPKCAECHVNQGLNLLGARLYVADCGICHDSPNRASFVPDLHALKVQTSFAYWKSIINNGKPNSLMPGFSIAQGGPLDNDQVHSLIEYLGLAFPSQSAEAH